MHSASPSLPTDLGPGAPVMIQNGRGLFRSGLIERTTATQIVVYSVQMSRRFRRNTGVEIGGDGVLYAHDAPAVLAAVRRSRAGEAMAELRNYVDSLRIGAKLYTDDPREAHRIADTIARLADAAVVQLAPLAEADAQADAAARR